MLSKKSFAKGWKGGKFSFHSSFDVVSGMFNNDLPQIIFLWNATKCRFVSELMFVSAGMITGNSLEWKLWCLFTLGRHSPYLTSFNSDQGISTCRHLRQKRQKRQTPYGKVTAKLASPIFCRFCRWWHQVPYLRQKQQPPYGNFFFSVLVFWTLWDTFWWWKNTKNTFKHNKPCLFIILLLM